MLRMIPRQLLHTVIQELSRSPTVAVLGPRQVGKTTLAKQYVKETAADAVHLDLDIFHTFEKLREHGLQYLRKLAGKLVIIYEVQKLEGIFGDIRSLVDEYRAAGNKYGHFLITGSASRDLLKQSAQSLAGRISYLKLTGLMPTEVVEKDASRVDSAIQKLWIRGGFPESYLASSDEDSIVWRSHLLTTYVEKDIPQMTGEFTSSRTLMRLWNMLAGLQGEPLNLSKLAGSLSMKASVITKYIDVMEDLMLLRTLPPFAHGNIKKRLVKSPRVYLRDSGLLHAALSLSDVFSVHNNAILGKSWEGFVIECIVNQLPFQVIPFYYRTASGAEIDLVVLEVRTVTLIAIDITYGSYPKTSKTFHLACADLKASHKYIIYSGEVTYEPTKGTTAIPLLAFLQKLPEIISEASQATTNPLSEITDKAKT